MCERCDVGGAISQSCKVMRAIRKVHDQLESLHTWPAVLNLLRSVEFKTIPQSQILDAWNQCRNTSRISSPEMLWPFPAVCLMVLLFKFWPRLSPSNSTKKSLQDQRWWSWFGVQFSFKKLSSKDNRLYLEGSAAEESLPSFFLTTVSATNLFQRASVHHSPYSIIPIKRLVQHSSKRLQSHPWRVRQVLSKHSFQLHWISAHQSKLSKHVVIVPPLIGGQPRIGGYVVLPQTMGLDRQILAVVLHEKRVQFI